MYRGVYSPLSTSRDAASIAGWFERAMDPDRRRLQHDSSAAERAACGWYSGRPADVRQVNRSSVTVREHRLLVSVQLILVVLLTLSRLACPDVPTQLGKPIFVK
jgi:hypothetical protein